MSTSRYNLRHRSSRPSLYPAKRRQAHKSPAAPKSKTVAAPAPAPAATRSAADDSTRQLYEKPEIWTQDHLRIANLQLESDVPFDKIVNVERIPLGQAPIGVLSM